MIKSSNHTTSYCNTGKIVNLSLFINEYRRVTTIILNDIWSNGYKWSVKDHSFEFNVNKNLLHTPSFIDYNDFKLDTFLTGRALSSLVTQLAGIISSSVKKQKNRLYILEKNKSEGKSKSKSKLLIRKIKTNIPQKPDVSKINPELSSKCLDWKECSSEFSGYLRLKSITKTKIEIRIPIKFHKHSDKLKSRGKLLNSFLIGEKSINFRWEIESPEQKKDGLVVGADQGMKDVLTLSDKQTTPNKCKHGHNLDSILHKLSKKKKGSKSFKRSQDHRTNFINWSINQINLDNVKELRLEKIWNIGYKSKTSRMMSHWTNTLIRDKVEDRCIEAGVLLVHQSSTYRSQRCSGCGVVRKANRKGKVYSCKHCGLELDADFNASLNHEIDLPEIPYTLSKLQMNRGNGFYWLKTGFYDFITGKCLESLPPVEDNIYIKV